MEYLIPGEIITDDGDIELNSGKDVISISVSNSGDRPIQVGSHYHFFETNKALIFNRNITLGMRLDIPAGTSIRFLGTSSQDARKCFFSIWTQIRTVCGFCKPEYQGVWPLQDL